MKTYIIEMPDDWASGECKKCKQSFSCHISRGEYDGECPIAKSKLAKEIHRLDNGKLYFVEDK